MIAPSTERHLRTPAVIGALVDATGCRPHPNLLDATRWGRWLPTDLHNPGSGNYRRLSERDVATVIACAWLSGQEPEGFSAHHRLCIAQRRDCDVLASVLNQSVEWHDYFIWHPSGKGSLVDDPAEVVARALRFGGARVVCLADAVRRVRYA